MRYLDGRDRLDAIPMLIRRIGYLSAQINELSTGASGSSLSVVNASDKTILKGAPMVPSGVRSNGVVEMYPADAAAQDLVSVYAATSVMEPGQEGSAILFGIVTGVPTNSVPIGTKIYVDGSVFPDLVTSNGGTYEVNQCLNESGILTTGAGYTASKPGGTSKVLEYAVTLDSSTDGSIFVYGNSVASLPNLSSGKYWVGNSNDTALETDIPTTSEGSGWAFDTITSLDSPKVITSWDKVWEVDNEDANIEITLPEITASDIGKELKFWIQHDTANFKVTLSAHSLADSINGVAGADPDKAKAQFNLHSPSYKRVTVRAVNLNTYFISEVDSAYNKLRYVVDLLSSTTSESVATNYLNYTNVPQNILTDANDFFIFAKLEKTLSNSSNGQSLLSSNSAAIAIRGNGTYFMTDSTSGYLMTISPTTIPEIGEYIIVQRSASTNIWEGWINGNKVLSSTGASFPATPATSMGWFKEPGDSNYIYNNTGAYSVLGFGTGLLSDSEAQLFTKSMFDPSSLSLSTAVVTGQHTFDDTGIIDNVGAYTLEIVGDDIELREI